MSIASDSFQSSSSASVGQDSRAMTAESSTDENNAADGELGIEIGIERRAVVGVCECAAIAVDCIRDGLTVVCVTEAEVC